MKCPRDGVTLQAVRAAGVEMDKCHHCDGIWLDHGELRSLLDAKATKIEETLEQAYGDPQYERGEVDGYMQCPRCDGRLQSIVISYATTVRVDRCEHCLGIWLDDRELDLVLGEKRAIETPKGIASLTRFLSSFLDKKQ